MKLSKQTDYAFRTLIFLGHLPEGQLSTIQHICTYYNISSNHVSKVVMHLVRLGYIEAIRGKGGGIRLCMPAKKISLVDVLKQFETTLKPIDCKEQPCRIIRSCKLKGVLEDALQAFIDTLKPYTLADILDEETRAILLVDK
ncbi:HTH-type transcriptional repressor NsrR [Zhongshania aliphaticivorans]|uniref:HTH-type transcriptional repressor NsrR n=1 Tax=Zhongshania aliphaticivorans TaxID=1470434 RepID=A0A5S9NAN9_9GAMM|nr:Rrf2 family transcriptional regulator [Zhongshania aliphaticivorans]CAA0079289.1 HTH-type transcriptional repressor NsrR [Zhongshania aliphaticivorans]CAA0086272.1 HTH-type transcriptional repressor NsrR [Zhongshania aliphaticivorans]